MKTHNIPEGKEISVRDYLKTLPPWQSKHTLDIMEQRGLEMEETPIEGVEGIAKIIGEAYEFGFICGEERERKTGNPPFQKN